MHLCSVCDPRCLAAASQRLHCALRVFLCGLPEAKGHSRTTLREESSCTKGSSISHVRRSDTSSTEKKKEKCIAPFCVRFALQDYYVFASLSLLDHSYYYHRITVTGARSQENEQHSSEQKSMVLFLSFPDRYLTQHLADSRLVSFLSIINNFSARRYSRRQKSTERGFHLIAVYPHSFFFAWNS